MFVVPVAKSKAVGTGRSTPDDILDMFNNFYSSEALPVDFDKKRIPQDKWTPAEVVQVQPSQAFKSTSLDVSFHFKNKWDLTKKAHL